MQQTIDGLTLLNQNRLNLSERICVQLFEKQDKETDRGEGKIRPKCPEKCKVTDRFSFERSLHNS